MILRTFYMLLLVSLVGAGAVAVDAVLFLTQPLKNDKPLILDIQSGTSFRGVIDQLYQKDLIKNQRESWYFLAYARLNGQANQVKSGEYQVPARRTPRQLLDLLVSGKIRLHKLTLVEGWRFKQIMQALRDSPAIRHQFTKLSSQEIMIKLGYPDEKAEGRFMPDTYLFSRGESDAKILRRAYDAMQDYLHKAWQNRDDDLAIDSPYEALILASLIEKETGAPEERQRISGVFHRRLQKGMRLQTDPSVIYGIAHYDGSIRKSNLKKDTPYNTYTRRGLPPTPIASPSRASIQAALHPEPGKALYFVARDDKTHIFSATLEEHNRAVRRYRQRQKEGS